MAARTISRLADGRVGKADDGEARQATRDVDLHRDRAAVDTVKSGGWDGGEHDSSHWTGTGEPGLLR